MGGADHGDVDDDREDVVVLQVPVGVDEFGQTALADDLDVDRGVGLRRAHRPRAELALCQRLLPRVVDAGRVDLLELAAGAQGGAFGRLDREVGAR